MSKVWNYKSKGNDPLSKQVMKDKSIVMTQPKMAIDLLGLISFKKGDKVLDPCRGDGAFYNNFPSYVKKRYCEINEGKDFFDYHSKVDYTISNPPFVPRKLFWEFHTHSMNITNKAIYWLINMSCLNVFTPKRLEEMKYKGWYIQSLNIVSDKRWFGRYIFIKISKEPNDIFTYIKETY